jgi:hypothetical protein
MEFVTADSLRWVDLEYDIAGVESEEELLRDVGDLLSKQHEKAKCALIARIDFTGRGELHHSLQKPGALAEIQDYFHQQMTEDIFINRLQDLTRPDFDLEKKREENSILGDYLRLSQSVNSDDELRRKVLLALAEVVDHLEVKSALEIHQSDEWLLQQLPQLIKLAEASGADLLMGEG